MTKDASEEHTDSGSVAQSRRMNRRWRRWVVTYLHAVDILHAYGERAWPQNVRFVWSIAKADVDTQWPVPSVTDRSPA